MSDYAHAINQHYGQAELSAEAAHRLARGRQDLDALTRDDLASFDEQHDGGRETTRELARLAGLREGMHVLDVGSGLGDQRVRWPSNVVARSPDSTSPRPFARPPPC